MQTMPWLGQEYPLVVLNAFSGLSPDLLGAVGGAVREGGLLVLLMPTAGGLDAIPRSGLPALCVAAGRDEPLLSAFSAAPAAALLQQDEAGKHWALHRALCPPSRYRTIRRPTGRCCRMHPVVWARNNTGSVKRAEPVPLAPPLSAERSCFQPAAYKSAALGLAAQPCWALESIARRPCPRGRSVRT